MCDGKGGGGIYFHYQSRVRVSFERVHDEKNSRNRKRTVFAWPGTAGTPRILGPACLIRKQTQWFFLWYDQTNFLIFPILFVSIHWISIVLENTADFGAVRDDYNWWSLSRVNRNRIDRDFDRSGQHLFKSRFVCF